jgi:fumarate reductase iron-sulfur subunit
MTETIRVTVTRAEPGREPREETFDVPFDADTSVLDVLDWIKENSAPSLTFRWSCRSGVCGSCGVMVNGRPLLGCAIPVAGFRATGLRIEPLASHEVQRDLAVDQTPFLEKLSAVSPWMITPDDAMPEPSCGEDGQRGLVAAQSREQLATYLPFAECLNCLLCYSACPVLAEVPDFLGPAAIALARRWDLDSRDCGEEIRAHALTENEFGIWPCTQDGSCTLACPKGVDPARAIRDYQREAMG